MKLIKRLFSIAGLLVLAFGSLALMLCLLGTIMQPRSDSPPENVLYDEAAAEVLAARSRPFDEAARGMTLHVEVDYNEGEAGSWYPKGESPILSDLVREGALPPVRERVGCEPAVMQGVDGIGKYGGSWYRMANSESDVGFISWRIGGATLARWSPMGYPIRPHLARNWSVSDDLREYTVHLRKGVRWSDGHPFTARDLVYWWENEVLYAKLLPRQMIAGGELGGIEMLDEYTVLFRFSVPNAIFPEYLARYSFWAPEHYLRPYHPALGDPVKIEAMMKAQGVASPRSSYFQLKDWRNPDHPQLWPWVLREHQRAPPYSLVRNPYYWVVDPEGNQLPYIDRLVNGIRSQDMLTVAAAAGDISMQVRHMTFKNHTLLMQSRDTGRFDVYFWFNGERSDFAIFPNLNRRVDPDDPSTRWKSLLLADARFRQALSMAINRRDIIRAEYENLVEPAQISPGRESPDHHKKLFHAFTSYDPEAAGMLLDELGLQRRDREGFRTFPDGSRMTFYLNICEFTGVGPSQFIISDWKNAGVRVLMKLNARSLWQRQQSALDHDLTVWTGGGDFLPLVDPRNFVPVSGQSFYASGFANWYVQGGLYGRAPDLPRTIEPPPGHPLRMSMSLLEQAWQSRGPEQRAECIREILDIAAENLWTISLATPTPQMVVVKNGMRNVPRKAVSAYIFSTPSNTGVETYFLDQPYDSPSALDAMKRVLAAPVSDPRRSISGGEVSGSMDSGGISGRMIRFLVNGILLLTLLLAVLRHPFILRRIMILGPTIAVISICVFTIIQLPPGDYITSRILELEMTGDGEALRQMEELRKVFHVDESAVMRYVRWVGLPWFAGFNAADRGLLQGDLGRSMEDSRRVNEIVGDRIVLTVLISLFTILVTWITAIPIGLYSATRQYSAGDYFFTFLGFIGMCVPPMLLALLLMYIGSAVFGMPVGGLFSPEYELQPEWTWGKVIDLLQHIWIPVIVLSAGSTAGMIRVLRANLLDELGKPYVTTARAKGVRPLKLLLKYPLRLALNPFISGIGNLFPAMVSGGAIVGIVMSLPTVGPMLLHALQAQDMYLAGSMLMVLSLLTVLGTLISDLLLMWVDPRIRMTGGAK